MTRSFQDRRQPQSTVLLEQLCNSTITSHPHAKTVFFSQLTRLWNEARGRNPILCIREVLNHGSSLDFKYCLKWEKEEIRACEVR